MARLLRMPALAANDSSTILAGWPLAEHSTFAAGDALATVETDKAVVDVEAEHGGVLLKTLVPAGTRVAVGDPIAVLGDSGEREVDIAALLGGSETTSSSAPPTASVAAGDDSAQREPTQREPAPARLFASPLARRLARESGLRLDDLHGTGPAGRIVRRDVAAAIASAAAAPPPATAPVPVAGRGAPRFTDVPHTRMRAAIASALSASKQQVPHFYLRATCRVDRLLDLRRDLCEADSAPRVSLNDLIVKAVARAQQVVPALNVSWHPDVLRTFHDVDIAVAVATPGGLVTPVLRSVDTLTVSAVAARMRDLAERARNGTLRQAEIDGGGITISNLGMFGVEEFAAIINPPQAAILAVGAVSEQPVAAGERIEVARTMRMTLSVDHRAVDGAVAAQWLRALVGLIEHPAQILA